MWGHAKQASTKICSSFQMYLGYGPFSMIISTNARWAEVMCVFITSHQGSLSSILSCSTASCTHERPSQNVHCKGHEALILSPNENSRHLPSCSSVPFPIICCPTVLGFLIVSWCAELFPASGPLHCYCQDYDALSLLLPPSLSLG